MAAHVRDKHTGQGSEGDCIPAPALVSQRRNGGRAVSRCLSARLSRVRSAAPVQEAHASFASGPKTERGQSQFYPV